MQARASGGQHRLHKQRRGAQRLREIIRLCRCGYVFGAQNKRCQNSG